MNTRRGLYAFAVFCLACSCAVARAADDKQLQNVRGVVHYQVGSTTKRLPPNATIVLADKDYTITGDASLAAVGLPDSSRVLVGSDSKVQLGFFNQVQGTNAKFVIFKGKVRFAVQHPAGAKADYTFQTPTASIAVRGTEGDIESANGQLRVNVYEVCDPKQPVTVRTNDGHSFTLMPGQSLLAQIVNGVVQAQVQQITQQMIDQFSGDFGVPTSWDAAKGEVVAYAQSQTSQALDNATGGYGSQVANALGGLFKKKSTPSPGASAAPKSDTCTHP
jgi:hypothetical protein